jgi:CubicO group peptidase (beta-lactamase class C family)
VGGPVERASLFRIASTTKPITAAATLALVREGLLELDEPVERLLPELANRRVLRRMDGPLDDTLPAAGPVTVRGLLTFTFGFGMAMEMFMTADPWPVVAAAMEAGLATIGPPQPSDFIDPDTWIARFGELPLFGAARRAVALQHRRARAERAVRPCRRDVLRRGAAHADLRAARHARHRLPHRGRPAVGDGVPADCRRTPGLGPAGGAGSRPPAFHDGAAGLVSTVDDLLAFARMLLRGGDPVLTAEQVPEMSRDHLTTEQREAGTAFLGGRGWGLGTSVVRDGPWAGAIGWDGGLGTSFLVHPERDLAVIVLTQRLFETAQAPSVHTDLRAAALAAGR